MLQCGKGRPDVVAENIRDAFQHPQTLIMKG